MTDVDESSNSNSPAHKRAAKQDSAATQRKKKDKANQKKKKKKKKFRPPPIKPFKESDSLTMMNMRREYLLYLHDFPSTMEEFGISSVVTYKYSSLTGYEDSWFSKKKKTLNLHIFNVSSQNGCIRISKARESIALADKRPRRGSKEFSNDDLDEIERDSGSSSKGGIGVDGEKDMSMTLPEFASLSASSSVFYLTHDSGMVEAGDTRFKVWPPIRRKPHRDSLWENLANGALEFVTSGHMPIDPVLKASRDGDFYKSFCGMISIELMLPAFFTEASARSNDKGDLNTVLTDIAKLMALKPAKFLGVAMTKGSIEVGKDADVVIWNPDEHFVVNKNGHTLQSKHSSSIYDDQSLRGVVKKTFVRGVCVFEGGAEGGNGEDARFPTKHAPTGIVVNGPFLQS